MKKLSILFLTTMMAVAINAMPRIERAEPLNWWTNMHTP